jgi:hypothetical protein
MFEEFKLLYELDLGVEEDILEVEEVDLHDNFDINQWRFGGGSTFKENEFQRYLKSPLVILAGKGANDEFDVLAWWKANQAEYPILSRIAIELHAIPGMSAEVERVFSGFVPF